VRKGGIPRLRQSLDFADDRRLATGDCFLQRDLCGKSDEKKHETSLK
jgi:hypothetical protein